MEAKQYAMKQPMDHWRNQRSNKKMLETNDYDKIHKNLWAKAVLRGNKTSPQETNRIPNKHSNPTSKATVERRIKP